MNGTILLVDDDRTIRQYCKRELQNAGYFVLLAHDGEDAMLVCSQIVPDLIVTDVHMRSCGGLNLVRSVKTRFPNMPVILHTSDDHCHHRGLVEGYVRKSQDLSTLIDVISDCLSQRQVSLWPEQLQCADAKARPG